MASIDKKVTKFSKEASPTLKYIKVEDKQNFAVFQDFLDKFNQTMELIEEKLTGFDLTLKSLMDKMNKT